MKAFYLLLIALPFTFFGQVNDDFEDGDFTSNPPWTGSTKQFIVNASSQIQLNDTTANIAYLVTSNSLANDCEWRFWVKLSFSPSANNNARIYLLSDNNDLSQQLNGYYLQLGESGSDDAIELFRQDGEALTSVLRGDEGFIASSFTIRIKVTRNSSGQWKLFADPAGGELFQLQGEGTDNTFNSTAFAGVFCKYTVSNSAKMYFDDIYVGPEIIDNEPPIVESVIVLSDSSLLVSYNEPVDKTSAEDKSNYIVNQGFDNPGLVILNDESGDEVTLYFDSKFTQGQEYLVEISGVRDLSENEMLPQQFNFNYYQAQPNDISINEIMADPTPLVGLTEYEYLELLNRTEQPINLSGWTLTVGSTIKDFSEVVIEPFGFLILSDEEAEDELSEYGPFYGFSSLPLTNSGQTLILSDHYGNTIAEVTYSDEWYKDPEKEDGGWSLEQINPENICSAGANWRASENQAGGTPGSVNSIYNDLKLLPRVDHFEIVANNILRLEFNQLMDIESIQDRNNYSVDQDIGSPSLTFLVDDKTNMIELYFENPFSAGLLYNLIVKRSILNCLGDQPGNDTTIFFGLGESAAENDLIINELLFNPWTNGVDYVEIYNRSDKVIDLNRLQLGTVKVSPPNPPDTLFYSIIEEQLLMVPGAYRLLTVSPEVVKTQYMVQNPDALIRVDPFPAYNNDEGTCLLYTTKNEMIDAFDYNEDMHYPLLNYVDGVALERISFDNPTKNENNWHSAAESAGFGTPTYQNSQYISKSGQPDQITVEPEIFSPDNDGYNDVITINYKFNQPGYSMTVNVFNSAGNLIRNLVNNEYLGVEGSVNWDGIKDDNTKAPVGIYVFFIQVYDLEGNVKKYKKTGVLASKL